MAMKNQCLPTNRQEMRDRGWAEVDFALVTGDGYVDHPSFGAAVISRVLESHGYRVGIIASPTGTAPGISRSLAARAWGLW